MRTNPNNPVANNAFNSNYLINKRMKAKNSSLKNKQFIAAILKTTKCNHLMYTHNEVAFQACQAEVSILQQIYDNPLVDTNTKHEMVIEINHQLNICNLLQMLNRRWLAINHEWAQIIKFKQLTF